METNTHPEVLAKKFSSYIEIEIYLGCSYPESQTTLLSLLFIKVLPSDHFIEILNIQMDNDQTIYDNETLNYKIYSNHSKKPNHKVCSNLSRTVRTWSTIAGLYTFLPYPTQD